MSDFKTRLEAERVELQEKLQKLSIFLGTEKIGEIHSDQKMLLLIQEKAMDTYLQCLKARIVRL